MARVSVHSYGKEPDVVAGVTFINLQEQTLHVTLQYVQAKSRKKNYFLVSISVA